MSEPLATLPPRKRAVVAVIAEENRLLVIRRSRFVVAPRQVCFPGGGIEPGEETPAALVREIQEELGTDCDPGQEIWRSVTPWGTEVHWWSATLPFPLQIVPNQTEVEQHFWMAPARLCQLPDLLSSNRLFLTAWEEARFEVPRLARDFPATETADGSIWETGTTQSPTDRQNQRE